MKIVPPFWNYSSSGHIQVLNFVVENDPSKMGTFFRRTNSRTHTYQVLLRQTFSLGGQSLGDFVNHFSYWCKRPLIKFTWGEKKFFGLRNGMSYYQLLGTYRTSPEICYLYFTTTNMQLFFSGKIHIEKK